MRDKIKSAGNPPDPSRPIIIHRDEAKTVARRKGGRGAASVALVVSAAASLCYLLFVAYLLVHPDQIDRERRVQIILATLLLLGGAIPGFVLWCFDGKAGIKITMPKIAFTTSGGYAVTILALVWFAPGEVPVTRVIELQGKKAGVKYVIDMSEHSTKGGMVEIRHCKKVGGEKDYIVCTFAPHVANATITFTARASNIPYVGTVEVTREGEPEGVAIYAVQPQESQ